jgi:hypothetical protein
VDRPRKPLQGAVRPTARPGASTTCGSRISVSPSTGRRRSSGITASWKGSMSSAPAWGLQGTQPCGDSLQAA